MAENAGANATVGTLSTTDPDAANTFTYTLVTGPGSTGNGSFNISGNTLRATASFDFEAQLVLGSDPHDRPGRPVLRGGLHDHGHQRQRDADGDPVGRQRPGG